MTCVWRAGRITQLLARVEWGGLAGKMERVMRGIKPTRYFSETGRRRRRRRHRQTDLRRDWVLWSKRSDDDEEDLYAGYPKERNAALR